MRTTLIAALFAVSFATPLFSQSEIDEINKLNGGAWKASLDSPTAKMTLEEAKGLMGALKGGPRLAHKPLTGVNAPDSFDPRVQWPDCPSISTIRDQSSCGSCWAFGAVEAMSDRECILKKDPTASLSAEDMNSCSGCGDCDGGYPSCAWQYWQKTGLVLESCAPYSLPSCDHHIANSTNPCPSDDYPTPACPKTCSATGPWKKLKAASVYYVSGETEFMNELSTHGPCEVALDVYSDFLTYTSGIYHHVSGSSLGGHAVKILGYGTENGVKYWLVANSWNPHWGENGYFRIRRGNNECGIEDEADCGLPA